MNKLILIVEDNKELNSILRLRMENHGFEVISCLDGKSALENIVEKKPEIVILDVDIPEIYGFELLSRVKSIKGCEETKFIIITGVPQLIGDVSSNEDWKNEVGVNAFLKKPFDAQDLLEEVKKLTE